MTFKERIQVDLLAAMKARDEVTLSTLRLLKSAIMSFEVSGKEKVEASDEDVLQILKKEVKRRQESIRQFTDGKRMDLVEKETAEVAVLQAYLPEMLSEEQVSALVEEVVASLGTVQPSDMGRVMGQVMGKVAGRADGTLVREAVQRRLAQG